jgi:hypothetical protein
VRRCRLLLSSRNCATPRRGREAGDDALGSAAASRSSLRPLYPRNHLLSQSPEHGATTPLLAHVPQRVPSGGQCHDAHGASGGRRRPPPRGELHRPYRRLRPQRRPAPGEAHRRDLDWSLRGGATQGEERREEGVGAYRRCPWERSGAVRAGRGRGARREEHHALLRSGGGGGYTQVGTRGRVREGGYARVG